MDILKETKLISNYIISLRKDFHKYPELSMEEYRTSKRIKEELDKAAIKKAFKDGVNTETGEYIPGITIEEIESITVKVEGGV